MLGRERARTLVLFNRRLRFMLSAASSPSCGGIVVYHNTDKLTRQARHSVTHGADSLFIELKAYSCEFFSVLAIYRRHECSLGRFFKKF